MRTQVIVVGAGPVGLLLGRLLERKGVETLVLERCPAEYVLGRIRAGILEHGTRRLLNEVGVGARMEAEAVDGEPALLAVHQQGGRGEDALAVDALVPQRVRRGQLLVAPLAAAVRPIATMPVSASSWAWVVYRRWPFSWPRMSGVTALCTTTPRRSTWSMTAFTSASVPPTQGDERAGRMGAQHRLVQHRLVQHRLGRERFANALGCRVPHLHRAWPSARSPAARWARQDAPRATACSASLRTCSKPGASFIGDRLHVPGAITIPPFPDLVRQAALA